MRFLEICFILSFVYFGLYELGKGDIEVIGKIGFLFFIVFAGYLCIAIYNDLKSKEVRKNRRER